MKKGGNGYSFFGDYGDKGCYAYRKMKCYTCFNSEAYSYMAFYGTGGSEDQMKKAVSYPAYRPNGYDCKDEGMGVFDYIR